MRSLPRALAVSAHRIYALVVSARPGGEGPETWTAMNAIRHLQLLVGVRL
jgi:hypothetical protein